MRPHVRSLLAAIVALNALNFGPLAEAVPLAEATESAETESETAATADITVTVNNDQWDSGPSAPGSGCSLREAVAKAGNEQGGDRGCGLPTGAVTNYNIKLGSGTYPLTLPLEMPYIGQGVTISILDSNATIDGGSSGANRHLGIFIIVNGTLKLRKITLRHGSRSGGGAVWLKDGAFTADYVYFEDNDSSANQALFSTGGALLAETGTLSVTHSTFLNNWGYDSGGAMAVNMGYFADDKFLGNHASTGGAALIGGAPGNPNPITFFQVEFKNNKARPQLNSQKPAAGYQVRFDTRGGGAIQNNGALQLTRVLFDGNTTELNKGGGALSNAGSASVLQTTFVNNKAQATGAHDTNSFISAAWGGAIYNAGYLDLNRVSIHENQADYAGAIFNHGAGDVNVYNSTIANNTGKIALGGIVNEHPQFDPVASGGAEVHLLHATVGINLPSGVNGGISDTLYSLYNDYIQLGNSMIDADGGCTGTQYTVGYSVIKGPCHLVVDPTVNPQLTYGDVTPSTNMGLGSLFDVGDGTVADFMARRLLGTSDGVDIGRNDQFGCNNSFIARKDQALAARSAVCDAGAIEAGQLPVKFATHPDPDPSKDSVKMPVVYGPDATSSDFLMTLYNLGGGAVDYQVLVGPGPVTLAAGAAVGRLNQAQETGLLFRCTPTQDGSQFVNVTINTSDPQVPVKTFLFRCIGAGLQQQAGTNLPAGPVNMPSQPAGQASHSVITATNDGSQSPMAVSGVFEQPGPPFNSTTTALVDAQGQLLAQAPDGPSATLNPGQSLAFDLSCAPTDYQVHLNTFVITTNDPINPHLRFNMSCEARIDSPPETLSPSGTYAAGLAGFEGVAVSPDGSQVLAGPYDNNTLRMFSRNTATGALTASGTFASGNMSQIFGIQYSHDGKNVYYTSQAGDGVVVLNRSNNALNFSQVLTRSTYYSCIIDNMPDVCQLNVMDGARGLAVSPDDQYVYVTGSADNTLTVFRRQPNGTLAYVQGITRTLNGVNVLGGAARVTTSPDGEHVYVTSLNDDSLAVFQRNTSGQLNFAAVYKDGQGGLNNLNHPADVAVSPDGKFVYVTSSADNALNIFQRSRADGQLTLSTVITGLVGAYGVALTRDNAGERLFLALNTDDKLKVYGRNEDSGALNPIGTLSNISSGNIDGPVFLAVSPDSQDVYVSLFDGQAVRHFTTQRNQPLVTHLSPASAPAGGASFQLTVVGGRFYPDSKINWGGAPLTTQFISENELRANITAGQIAAPGSVNVAARNTSPGGGVSLAVPFVITGPGQPLVPSVEGTVPEELVAGEDDILVYVQGANFAPDAEVYYNLIPVPAYFINDHTLQVTLWATLLEQPGTAGIQVVNGGGAPAQAELNGPSLPEVSQSSLVAGFHVTAPGQPARPALASLQPASVLFGSTEAWITVHGQNFSTDAMGQSVGRWNGLARPTVVVDSATLLMQATEVDLVAPGSALITVLTPGANESEPLTFRVRAAGEKPVPVLSSVMPAGFTLYVNGSDFDPAAQIRFNGVARPTTFVSSDQLKLTLSPADHAAAITVFNPPVGGGTSNELIAFLGRLFLPIIRK